MWRLVTSEGGKVWVWEWWWYWWRWVVEYAVGSVVFGVCRSYLSSSHPDIPLNSESY
jgi:hypothetical protein